MHKKLSEEARDLMAQIPVEQRQRILKIKAYREGWLDSTLFWKLQLDKTFKRWEQNVVEDGYILKFL